MIFYFALYPLIDKMTWIVSMHSFENIKYMKTNNLSRWGMLKLEEEKGLGYANVVSP